LPGAPQRLTTVSEWTVDTLKVLMDERDRRYELMASAAKEAVDLFRDNNEKWREMQNEWRATMNDKDRNFVTKAALWGYAVGIVGLVLSLMLIVEKIRPF
jgi:hypothetical protein